MSRTVRYHKLFDCDVREAADWYDRRSPGLGRAFIDAVELRVFEAIHDPSRLPNTESGIRYLRIPRFPYLVLFDLTDDTLHFVAVFHTARESAKADERRTAN